MEEAPSSASHCAHHCTIFSSDCNTNCMHHEWTDVLPKNIPTQAQQFACLEGIPLLLQDVAFRLHVCNFPGISNGIFLFMPKVSRHYKL